ncbi:hypothetical protein J4573_43020 [Actinomadura barringtoniae]|uniref:Uncharacterized protein n=1 Tax=Actinomadura barringtoniae TaxID=1427535 RepID=A0A939T8A0_9ACTN|nr:hypothetical protein [Actinomadura barringtoniae]MBO2453923.1 hypothetical protein [Actinomadura barringtoniae]
MRSVVGQGRAQDVETHDRIPDFRVSALPEGGWRAVSVRDPAIVVIEQTWARLRRGCMAERIAYSLTERFRVDLEREFPGWKVWRVRHLGENDRWAAEPRRPGHDDGVRPNRPRLVSATPEELRTALLLLAEPHQMAS